MKIIFCTDGIFPIAVGGMQRHSRLLVEALSVFEDLQIIVVHPHKNEKIFNGRINIIEQPVDPPPRKKQYLLECYDYSKRVYRVINNHPDAIIYSQGLSVWAGIKYIGDRVIVNPHGLESYQAIGIKNKLIGVPFKLIFDYIFRNSRKVVSLGGRLTDILHSRIPGGNDRVVVLPNGTNITHDNAPVRSFKEPIKFLFVGRFARNKGIHILIEAIKILNQRGYQERLKFHFVGKGPLFKKYSETISSNNVVFHGYVDDERLNDLYKKSDAFILPTLFEGMPTVVLEAMKFGLPVIVTDVGATREMVDKNNGYLINKNDVHNLVRAIIDYVNSPLQQKRNMSDISFLRVKQSFTWDVIAHNHREVFKNMYNELN